MVHTRYCGYYPPSDFFYGSEEDYQAIKNGEIFKVEGDFDWYYKSIPFENRTDEIIPEEMVCLRKQYISSKQAKRWLFFKLVQNSNAKIYYGDSLKDKLVQEVGIWMRDINPRTKKAFSGRDFTSFINTIPAEIIVDEDFCDKMKRKMKNTLCQRVKNSKSINEIISLTGLKKYADELVDRAHKVGAEHFAGGVRVVQNAVENIEQARARALAELSKSCGKVARK